MSDIKQYAEQLGEQYGGDGKVLLIQVPQTLPGAFNKDVAKARGCYAYPPIGLMCIEKVLTDLDIESCICDLNYWLLYHAITEEAIDYNRYLDILKESLDVYEPSAVGVTCLTPNATALDDKHPLTATLKILKERDESIVIIGGPIATNEYKSYLDKGLCHFAVTGEGEDKAKYLFGSIFNKEITPVSGIYYKEDGAIIGTDGACSSVQLSGNLIDEYRRMPVETYCQIGTVSPFHRMTGADRPYATIQLNRGCRADCTFCGVTKFTGKGLRQYPVKDIIAELDFLVNDRHVQHFNILDDDFLGIGDKSSGAIAVLGHMASLHQRFGVTWAAPNGLVASSLNFSLLELMRDSGCAGFRIGIESGEEAMWKRMNKPGGLETVRRVSTELQDFPELFVGANYIIGLFGEETFGQMLQTLRTHSEVNLDWASVSIYQQITGDESGDFTPSKDVANHHVADTGIDIFALNPALVPSRDEIRDIWFGFNLVANYINNKNLQPTGNACKFAKWIDAVRICYPDNPYMPMFLGLANLLQGKPADTELKICKDNIFLSEYWQRRFDEYNLSVIIDNYPTDKLGAEQAISDMRKPYERWIGA